MRDAELVLPEALAARYTVLDKLGEGAMGAVYRVVQVALDRQVALKVIRREMFSGEAKDRFLQEAKLAARINHPNVVAVYEAGDSDGVPFIAFELVTGPSLRRVLEEGGRLDPFVAVQYTFRVAAGLHAAHEEGIIHRDVKPENILIARNGEAKIADFGISRPQRDDQPGLTRAGTILGSPLYMSPEQVANRELTGATDQYSLGVVLYEMLVGKPPFNGSTGEILARHLRDPIQLPPGVRSEVRRDVLEILEVMLRKEPAERYPTAAELARVLEVVVGRWQGPRKTTIPTKVPRPRAPEVPEVAPPPAEVEPEAVRTGARSGARTGGRTGPRVETRLPQDREPVFEPERMPLAVQAGLIALMVVALIVIGYWLGRSAQPSHAGGGRGTSRGTYGRAAYPDGTVVGHVGSHCYHIVGEEDPRYLPSRENARTFENVEEAIRAGYHDCRR